MKKTIVYEIPDFEDLLAAGNRSIGAASVRADPPAPHDMFIWESDAPEAPIGLVTVAEIDHFVARGMRRVYGRGDHYGGGRTLNMDIWKNKHGRLFMRCWSRHSDYWPASFEIIGIDPPEVQKRDGRPVLNEDWVPQVVRDTYDEWARGEF